MGGLVKHFLSLIFFFFNSSDNRELNTTSVVSHSFSNGDVDRRMY